MYLQTPQTISLPSTYHRRGEQAEKISTHPHSGNEVLGSRTNPMVPAGVLSVGGQQKSVVPADCRGTRAW